MHAVILLSSPVMKFDRYGISEFDSGICVFTWLGSLPPGGGGGGEFPSR